MHASRVRGVNRVNRNLEYIQSERKCIQHVFCDLAVGVQSVVALVPSPTSSLCIVEPFLSLQIFLNYLQQVWQQLVLRLDRSRPTDVVATLVCRFKRSNSIHKVLTLVLVVLAVIASTGVAAGADLSIVNHPDIGKSIPKVSTTGPSTTWYSKTWYSKTWYSTTWYSIDCGHERWTRRIRGQHPRWVVQYNLVLVQSPGPSTTGSCSGRER